MSGVRGLDDDMFDELRRSMFKLFARFLVEFVRTRVRRRRLITVGVLGAALVVAAGVWLVARATGG